MKRTLILLVIFSVVATGCVPKDMDVELPDFFGEQAEVYYVVENTRLFKTSAAQVDVGALTVGDEVSVLSTQGEMAQTSDGWVRLSNLEKERSMFRLTVKAAPGSTVKILNIKPKYHDGMWLKKGKYHLGVYAKGKAVQTRWVNLAKDRVVIMDGSKSGRLCSLTVSAPLGATVKILNIGPKYRDGIMLRPGKYHVAVYENGKRTYNKWVNLQDDMKLDATGQAVANSTGLMANASVQTKKEKVSQTLPKKTPATQAKVSQKKKSSSAKSQEAVASKVVDQPATKKVVRSKVAKREKSYLQKRVDLAHDLSVTLPLAAANIAPLK